MVTVYIWDKERNGVDSKSYGHAAMQVGDTYISWWPNTNNVVSVTSRRANVFSAEPYRNRTHEDDLYAEGRRPDHVIHLKGLNEGAIKGWWEAVRHDGLWKTLNQNCSTVVTQGLKAGGADKHALWTKAHEPVWRPESVREYALSVQRGLQADEKRKAVQAATTRAAERTKARAAKPGPPSGTTPAAKPGPMAPRLPAPGPPAARPGRPGRKR